MSRDDSTRYLYGKKYDVGLVIEMFKDYTIVALDEKQAEQIAVSKAKKSIKTLQRMGYYVGDVEAIEVNKKKIGFKK